MSEYTSLFLCLCAAAVSQPLITDVCSKLTSALSQLFFKPVTFKITLKPVIQAD